MEDVEEATIDLVKYGMVREFMKEKLHRDGIVTLEDVKSVAPKEFKDDDLAFLLMVKTLTDIADDMGIEYVEISKKADWIKVVRPDEYDPQNQFQFPVEVIEDVVEDITSRG